MHSVLEVVLQNTRCQGRTHSPAIRFDFAHDFSAAHNLGRGESRNLGRQHQIDFHQHARLKGFIPFEQHARAADVFGRAFVPVLFTKAAVA